MNLIVEMEMPKNCYLCPMANFFVDKQPYCRLTMRWDECTQNGFKRPSWCPIKGVLPEEHGDLIDTSTVVGSIKRETDIHDVTLKEYLGFKFPVQTIVPIDEFLENRKTIPIIVAAERKDDDK